MSFKKYRLFDLFVFTILYFVFEFIAQKAAIDWFPGQPFSVSLLLPMLLLVIMRWDYYASPLLIIFGMYFVLVTNLLSENSGAFYQYAIYVIGNIGLVITIILLKKIGKETIRKKIIYTIAYVAVSYIIVEVFRSISAIIFAHVGIEIFIQYIFTDLLNLLFALILVLITRSVPGLFEDQKAYLIRINKEKENNN